MRVSRTAPNPAPGTQQARLLESLASHPEGITPFDAMREVGTTRLAARIWDLKRRGWGILTEMVEVSTRDGTARVARYTLQSITLRGAANSTMTVSLMRHEH